jgi:dynactin complex subunit
MADYKELFGSLVNKAKDVMESTGVTEVYQKGASRTKAYSRIARLTLDTNSQAEELRKVYTEIGRLYFEQARENPEGVFAPLFAQAGKLMDELKAKEDELEELKRSLGAEAEEKDIEVEITQDIDEFDQVVSATEAEGKGGED